MSFDINTETSLDIAEKLLEQEHIINMRRIAVLSKMFIKLADRYSKIKDLLSPEIDELISLERGIKDLETTSMSVLSPDP